MLEKELEKLKYFANRDKSSIERLLVKTTEELGELAESINHFTGNKKSNKTWKKVKNDIYEESVDIVLCLLIILNKTNHEGLKFNKKYFEKTFNKKLKKYHKHLTEPKKHELS